MFRIASLLALAVTAAVPATAGAQELPAQNVCVGQSVPAPPPTKAEKEQAALVSYASQRAEFGFRADLAYVKRLVERGVWEYDVGYIPVTPAENRYLRLRDRLELGPRAERYLRAHRDVDGGVSVEDDWPREPYLLLHFKRDVRKHLEAVRELARFPRNLRAERVRYSDRDLRKIADRIWADDDALEAEGFFVTGTGHAADGYLHVDLITRRTDFKAYFERRYGKAVKIEVEATERYSFQCTDASAYTVAADGLSVTVNYSTGGGNQFARAELTEYPDRVEVGVVEKVFNGPNTADLRFGETVAALSAPLGDRPVVDAYNRKPLQQIGSRPGQPPCAPAAEPTPLEQAIEERAAYGMRADPAYVQQLLALGRPYTRAELRWLGRLQEIDGGDEEELDSELSRRHPRTYAGSVIVARYPQPPRVVYRFTREARKHLAEIRRKSRFPDNARVGTAKLTLSAAERLRQRLQDAFERQATFDGFTVISTFPDRSADSVRISLVTQRSDAQAYFTARFGPFVTTEVVGDRMECYLANRPLGG